MGMMKYEKFPLENPVRASFLMAWILFIPEFYGEKILRC